MRIVVGQNFNPDKFHLIDRIQELIAASGFAEPDKRKLLLSTLSLNLSLFETLYPSSYDFWEREQKVLKFN